MRMKTLTLAVAVLTVVLLASPASAEEPSPTRPGGEHGSPGPGPSAIVDPWVTPSDVELTTEPTAEAPTTGAPQTSHAPAVDAPTLPKTGPAEGLLAGGAALVLGGVGLLVFARRRRDSHAA